VVALALLPKGTTQEFVLIVIHQVLMLGIVGSPDQVASQGWLDVRIRNFTFGQPEIPRGTDEINLAFFRLTGSSVRL
jgi:hypothetical protein